MDLNDLEKLGDQWIEWITNDLQLDPKNSIHSSAAFALSFYKHLYQPATKTTARKYENKLDQVTECALKLSETINSLEPRYKDGLAFSLRGQHDIDINNSEKIDYFIQSLAKAAQAVKNAYLTPIPNGYYNTFLFQFVDNVLQSYVFEHRFIEYLILHNIQQPEKSEVKKLLYDLWKNHYLTKVRDTAIHVIQIKLSTSRNRQTAQKSVDTHLSQIVDERLENKANNLIKLNTLDAEEIIQIRSEMGLK